MADRIRGENPAPPATKPQEAEGGCARRPETGLDAAAVEDDSLVLLFMCCHPVNVILRYCFDVARRGRPNHCRKIASAFLVPEATMAQRISRAKQSIKASGIPFQHPDRTPRRVCAGCFTFCT